MRTDRKIGKVIIAGAGPGDPELITYKAIRALRGADVVLTDRLVSAAILEEHMPATAIIEYVGKQAHGTCSTSQEDINRLLVFYAVQGKQVVRLKGGDVSVFSNILDEMRTLVEHQIPYELIPGVTAAAGAAAYSGIPLTARGYASSVRFLTCHHADSLPEAHWRELARTDDTLVFYMSGEALRLVVRKLTNYSIDPAKQLALIEQATTPFQNVFTCSLYEYEERLAQREFVSPSLVIIGKVVGLHEEFQWLENSGSVASYFSPLKKDAALHPLKEEPVMLTA